MHLAAEKGHTSTVEFLAGEDEMSEGRKINILDLFQTSSELLCLIAPKMAAH